MKNFTKFLAVMLVFIIAISTTACSLTPQWSYKNGENELSIGVYIYAMYNAYTEAQSYAQQTEGYDSEAGTYDGETSFLNVQITDDDGNTATADQWILDETERTMKTLLAIDAEYERLGATMDEATIEGNKATAKEYWDYGPYYAMYGEQYKSPLKDTFEPLGVSYESFEYFYLTSAKQEVIFDILYTEGGEKAVDDKELTDFFTTNYTSYVFFNTNLYTTEESTADEGGALSTNKAFSKKEISKYENTYESYVNDIKSGKSIDDVIKKMMKDENLDADPSSKSVEIMENSSIGEDLVSAINELKEGQASYKIVGEEDTQVIYFFYKEPIDNQVKAYIEDATNRKSVLQQYKGEEFQEYMDKLSTDITVDVNNKAVKKYSPADFEDVAPVM